MRDLKRRDDFSLRDLAWDGIGGTTGAVLVRQIGIPESMYLYYFALSDQVGSDGSPFAVPPASVQLRLTPEPVQEINEPAFADPLAAIFSDPDHSDEEVREILVGHSERNRLLVVSFTERDGNIRIISARVASAGERRNHEENQMGGRGRE